jgi:hypothetical protein
LELLGIEMRTAEEIETLKKSIRTRNQNLTKIYNQLKNNKLTGEQINQLVDKKTNEINQILENEKIILFYKTNNKKLEKFFFKKKY